MIEPRLTGLNQAVNKNETSVASHTCTIETYVNFKNIEQCLKTISK